MTQNIPYLEYMTTDCGTRKNPFLIHVKSGEGDNSHVLNEICFKGVVSAKKVGLTI